MKPDTAMAGETGGAARAGLLAAIGPDFEVSRGRALPLGATVERGGVNFAVFSEHATGIVLALFRPGEREPLAEFPLDPRVNRTGHVWHVFVGGLDAGLEYGYRAERSAAVRSPLDRFDPRFVLLDPCAHGCSRLLVPGADGRAARRVRRSVIIDHAFDWEHDQPLDRPLAETVIYELHVRAFTRAQGPGAGTFRALTGRIPYLRGLGVTAVELMPIVEFEEDDNPRTDPGTGRRLVNFWGYHPLSFFAPHLPYGSGGSAQETVRELKEMVKAFHAAGIEVILDVVFNHFGEGDGVVSRASLRGLDNAVYYLLDAGSGEDRNYSGCGNTLNCNHPVFRELVLQCLRYWVMEFHVDGFRFDLASILGRGRDGSVLPNPPLLERIACDAVLARTKLIAEAWDASGLYQVGTFPAERRWAEWNGKFRDEVRRFVRGEPGLAGALATRLAGSSDLYQASGRTPCHSINFITCHDGFTLADLVAYDGKHNQANGEENRDGCDQNFSWNCGAEGPTERPEVLALRERQARNFLALLLLAQGVPLLLYGDEFGRSQQGNNNLYCHDSGRSWVDWSLARAESGRVEFVRRMLGFRRAHRVLRRDSFAPVPGGPQIEMQWHGERLDRPDWGPEARSLALHLFENGPAPDHLYLVANAGWEPAGFQLPQVPGRRWARFLDTAEEAAIAEPGQERDLEEQSWYRVRERSIVVLVGRAERGGES